MNEVGKPERLTQNRVIALFCDAPGYRYLGDVVVHEWLHLWSNIPANASGNSRITRCRIGRRCEMN